MDNYVYIVAGLPDLTANFGSSQFSYTDVREPIAELLSDADCQLVALLDDGFDEAALNADFYSRAAASRNRFIREYFDFDARMRNLQAEYVARAANLQADKYLMELPEAEFDDEKRVLEVLANADFLQREQQVNDKFYQDICTPYKTKNSTDILLTDRIDYIYNNEDTKCQINC
ncbi:MAG: DUF2764 family protein, partial [Salinivirgaceae bacterium]|nr:DUF2764 family protein [Salinivirgaceae bacterium]